MARVRPKISRLWQRNTAYMAVWRSLRRGIADSVVGLFVHQRDRGARGARPCRARFTRRCSHYVIGATDRDQLLILLFGFDQEVCSAIHRDLLVVHNY